MTTFYLGGSHISYEDPHSSRLSKRAEEAAYFQPSEPENTPEFRAVPTLAMFAAAVIGLLTLCLVSGDDGHPRPNAGPVYATNAQSYR
jgi:hypothetical protein